MILEFAAARAGLTLVTANPAYRPRELRFVLEQSRSVGLFIAPAHRGTPMAEIAAEVAAELPALREVVDITDADQLFARGPERRGLPDVQPGDAVQIQYTSGTTGFPKGALLHHRGLINNARLTFARAGVQRRRDGAELHADVPHLRLRLHDAWPRGARLPDDHRRPVRSRPDAGHHREREAGPR